ncbi:putative choline/ethanolamine phosphotransferase [Trypanosoma cruzi]|uniref:Putative choline/ethanolamine phosphotransferase n=1 Tax=Trypanosoma cruzi TaxID=5693 RepID=A0A2V2X233_TRYCR|nr:putative choline/ethanolamine phosphotransferase [Trypanosoma cruzi]
MACTLFIITGLYSTSIWDTPVISPYELKISFFYGEVSFVIFTLRSLIFLYITVAACLTVGANIVHVVGRPGVHVKGTPFFVMLPMLFLLFFHVCLFLTYTSIHDKYPFAFELSFGFLTSYTVTRMTVARLCAMPYSLFNAFYLITFCVTFGALVVHAHFRQIEIKIFGAVTWFCHGCVSRAGGLAVSTHDLVAFYTDFVLLGCPVTLHHFSRGEGCESDGVKKRIIWG